MDVIVALTGKDYVMVVADQCANRSIFKLKGDEDKISVIAARAFLASGGDSASRTNFSEYVARNFALNTLRTGLELSMHESAHFVRNELASAIRSRGGAHNVNSLLGGVDDKGASLYHLDYLGSLSKVDFGAQGYAAYFNLSLMDRQWKKNMTLAEGRELLMKCIAQLDTRFIVNNPTFRLLAVGKEGKILDEIVPGHPQQPV